MKYVRTLFVFLSLLVAGPALAQWQVPDHSVPIGRGGGTTGFKNVTPLAAGSILAGTNTATDPAFTNIIRGQNYLAPMTNTGEAYGYSFRNSTVTGTSIYTPINAGAVPSVQDGIQSVLNIPSTATVPGGQVTGVASYFQNNATSTVNAVGYFTAGICATANSACWGLNTLLTDNATRTVHSRTGEVLLNELDFNVTGANTQVLAMSIGGNSIAQPTSALGFLVNSLGSISGTPVMWSCGVCIQAGTSTVALSIGAMATSGANIASQPINLAWRDGSGNSQTTILQMANGFLSLQATAPILGISFPGSLFMGSATGIDFNGTLGISGDGNGNVTIGSSGHSTTLPSLAAAGVVETTSGGLLSSASTVSGALGGTGVANTGKTVTLGGDLTTSGAFASTFTMTGTTNVTFPTSGTLAATASPTFSGTITFPDSGTYSPTGLSLANNLNMLGSAIVGATMIGGGVASSTLTFESTFGTGTTDAIIFKTGSQVEAARILSSQVFKFGAASFTANGSVATTMTSLGPTGSHATVQTWFTVQDSTGTVRYIPAY